MPPQAACGAGLTLGATLESASPHRLSLLKMLSLLVPLRLAPDFPSGIGPVRSRHRAAQPAKYTGGITRGATA